MSIVISLGDARDWSGDRSDVDLVFTHPYSRLPHQLLGKPMIINLHGDKQARAEVWCEAELIEIGRWSVGGINRVYVANMAPDPTPIQHRLSKMRAVPTGKPNSGWMPVSLPLLLLKLYAREGQTVWDGFMGRGTIGRACQQLGMSYIGIDRDPARVEVARKYLKLTGDRA